MELNYHINLIKRLLVREYPILQKVLKVNYGLVPEELSDKDYIMGASDDKINWQKLKRADNPDWLEEAEQMIHEVQKNRFFDSMGCTGYALNNIEEMLEIKKGYERINRSDRFLNKMSGTTRRGNSMSNVLETRRNKGFVAEEDWPWDRQKFNWNDYYAAIPPSVTQKALHNNKKYTFGYDGVWATRSMLNEALKYSPLYVALYAWYRKGMLYYSVANPNHASVIISRNQFINYDSYNPHIKYLSDDFKVYYCKRIYLAEKQEEYNKEFIDYLLNRGFKYIQRTDKFNGGAGQGYELKRYNFRGLDEQEKKEKGIRALADLNVMTGISEKDFRRLTV